MSTTESLKYETSHLSEDPQLQRLFSLAMEARDFSYSPYSKFRVGACLLTESDDYIIGCNVENASYGLTICAERNALCAAIAKGHKKFKAIAVTSDVKESFTYPCGACLQFMLEVWFTISGELDMFGRNTPVYFLRADLKAVDKRLVRELVPFGFGPEDLDLMSQKTNALGPKSD